MSVVSGNTSSSFNSAAQTNASRIISFSLCNKTGGAVTASVGIFYGSTIVYILYNKSVATADSYIYTGNPITIPVNYNIYVNVSGSTDYYFSIEGI
jgi:hypothetical protein